MENAEDVEDDGGLNEIATEREGGIKERLLEVERQVRELLDRVACLDGFFVQQKEADLAKAGLAREKTNESTRANQPKFAQFAPEAVEELKVSMVDELVMIMEERIAVMVEDMMFDEAQLSSRKGSTSNKVERGSGLGGALRGGGHGNKNGTQAPMGEPIVRGSLQTNAPEDVPAVEENRVRVDEDQNSDDGADREQMDHRKTTHTTATTVTEGGTAGRGRTSQMTVVGQRRGSIHVAADLPQASRKTKSDGSKSYSLSAALQGTMQSQGAVEYLCKNIQADGVPILDAAANENGAQDWIYDWHETMWDAMPFVGLNVMTCMDAVLVCFIAALNICVQCAFIGLVGANMTSSDFDGGEIVQTLTDWRVIYGHNPDFADKFTSKSLSADVCDESDFLMQGATQAIMYSDIVSFINNWLRMSSGGCLCMLSVFLWTMTCAKEMKRITLFMVGLWTPNEAQFRAIKRSYVEVQERSVIWVYGEATQKNFQAFFTLGRTAMITFFIVLPRFAILAGLFGVGARFLVTTRELNELVLNCVALEVVLNVDDLLFHIFVPDSALRMVRKTKPLRIPKLHGPVARAVPWMRVIVMFGLLTAIYVVWLRPLIDVMRDAAEVMCGGDVGFLASEITIGGIVVGEPQTSEINREGYPYRAIYQRTNLLGNKENKPIFIEGGPFAFNKVQQLDKFAARPIAEWADLDLSDPTYIPCTETFYVRYKGVSPTAFWEGISHVVGHTARGCSDLAPHFIKQSNAGRVSRLMCPTESGAEFPLSGNMAITKVDAVSAECQPWFAVHLIKMPCHDQNLKVLQNATHPIGIAWRRWEESFRELVVPVLGAMALGNKTHFMFLAQIMIKGMLSQGCDFFKGPVGFPALSGSVYMVNFCDTKDERLFGRLSMRSFCPETCGCHTKVLQSYTNAGEMWDLRTGRESHCPASCWLTPAQMTALFKVPSAASTMGQMPVADCMQPSAKIMAYPPVNGIPFFMICQQVMAAVAAQNSNDRSNR